MGRTVLALMLAVVLAAVVVACGGTAATGDAPSTAPAATPSDTPTTSAETGAPAGSGSGEVAALFADDCAGCHGAGGGGGTGPDLRGEDDLGRVKSQIESGGDQMPAFSGRLTAGQIDALAQYVVSGLQ
jgi:mono/diheme cytochrome c family protein